LTNINWQSQHQTKFTVSTIVESPSKLSISHISAPYHLHLLHYLHFPQAQLQKPHSPALLAAGNSLIASFGFSEAALARGCSLLPGAAFRRSSTRSAPLSPSMFHIRDCAGTGTRDTGCRIVTEAGGGALFSKRVPFFKHASSSNLPIATGTCPTAK
jgi:hypothetical protein